MLLPHLLTALMRHHISEAAERLAATQVEGSPSERVLAVGFVDMVGYSARASQVSMGELFELVSGSRTARWTSLRPVGTHRQASRRRGHVRGQ